MEDSEIQNELMKEIHMKIDVERDKNITLFLLKNKNKNSSVERLIEELNLLPFKKYLYDKYSLLNSSGGKEFENNEIVWQNLTEDDNYEELLSNLSQCSFLSSEMLDELLKINYIDTRHSYWQDISYKLQECFSSSNYDLFLKCLKLHYKMIITQNCCIDGYLSLLKATNKIVESHFMEKFEEENILLDNRVLLCIKVILSSELFMLHSIHTGNNHILEDIVDNLFSLFSFQKNIQDKQIAILDYISFIDEKAEWFKYLCLSGYTRIFIYKKMEKYPNLRKWIFEKFFVPLNDNMSNIDNNLEKSIYTHSCYFLIYFFNIHENINEFELKIHETQSYNFSQLLTLIIYAIHNHVSSEIKDILKNFIILCLQTNPFLINKDILEILFKPFENIIKDNSLNVINKNSYLFTLIQFTVQNNEKILTDGYLYNRRKYKSIFNFGSSQRGIVSASKNFVNLPQLIIDITILMLRNYINNSEKKQSVDANTLLLLECSEKIFNSHPVFLYNSMTSKFIVNLLSFYKVLNNFSTTKQEIENVLNVFNFFFKYHSNILKLLKDKTFIVNILNSVILNKIEVSSCIIFNNFSNEISIMNELHIQLHLATISFLLSAWSQECAGVFENILKEENFIELLQFFYGISHSTNLIRMLVAECPNLNLKMKSVIPIFNLLKLSTQNCRDSLETYTGLHIIKVLITNLDGLVILQANCDLKDNLLQLQNEGSDSEDEGSNPNACDNIRKNLMLSIDYVGYPNKVLDDSDDSFHHNNLSGTKLLAMKCLHNCDLQKFLHSTRSALHDHSWMNQVKSLFYKFCSEGYKVAVVYEIISQCPKQGKITKAWPESGISLPQLHKEDIIAISIIVRYGLQNGLLKPGYRHEENLALLVKQSRVFLEDQSEEFNGFDWYIAVCFLVCSGNIERCKSFCISLSQIPCINLVWYKYGEKFGGSWLENFQQHLNVFMAENTILYTALKMVNLSPAMIIGKWLGQCFFNILDFREICNFILFLVLSPLDCSVYYMLCLFIHNKKRICLMTHTPSVKNLLDLISLEDFKLITYLHKINQLSVRYRNIIKL